MTDKSEIKLGRVGHYSYQEVCQEATIVHVNPPAFDSDGGYSITVTITGHDQDGDEFVRKGVKVGVIEGPDAEFHLNRDCPWER